METNLSRIEFEVEYVSQNIVIHFVLLERVMRFASVMLGHGSIRYMHTCVYIYIPVYLCVFALSELFQIFAKEFAHPNMRA